MSLWRRGIVFSCHPVGPGLIPGVGAISLWKNLLQMRTWLSRLWFHQCFVRWGWTYPPTSSNFLLAEATTFSSFIGWSKFVCIINSYNFGCFKCMSLWRRGTVLNCHPVGPGSIPGVGIHYITEALNRLCKFAYRDESRKPFLSLILSNTICWYIARFLI